MSVCAPPVLCSSLVSTMHHSHSMGVFNSLLIKRICILFVVFPAFALQRKSPRGITFAAFLAVLCDFDGWLTDCRLRQHGPSIFLASDCVTDSRDACLSHLYGFSLAFSLLPPTLYLISKTCHDQKGCGLSVWFPAVKVWAEEVNESHHSHGDTTLATGCTGPVLKKSH